MTFEEKHIKASIAALTTTKIVEYFYKQNPKVLDELTDTPERIDMLSQLMCEAYIAGANSEKQ